VEYGAVLRAQVHAEALGLNPLENGEEGVSQLPKAVGVVGKGKKRKKGKCRLFHQGSTKSVSR